MIETDVRPAMTGDKRPWKRQRPAGKTPTRLSAKWRQKARTRARAAGRRYPNLVDNMWASTQQRKSRTKIR
jgi:hypothetical protein